MCVIRGDLELLINPRFELIAITNELLEALGVFKLGATLGRADFELLPDLLRLGASLLNFVCCSG